MKDDKNRLQMFIQRAITKVFDDALKTLEVVVTDESQYKRIRSRILRSGNDQIRLVSRELEKYDVKYHPEINEHIQFGQDK